MSYLRFAPLILLLLLGTSPLLSQPADEQPPALRIGYGVTSGVDLANPTIRSLGAGVYNNWRTNSAPATPDGIHFAQTVRVHQILTCPLNSENAWNRDVCPYAEPHSYQVKPALTDIAAIVQSNPSSLWLIGNEMDRRDWHLGGQDEMLPELYATAYHDIHAAIKAADPTAQVAIGGLIQATPLRLAWLERMWNAYEQQYGEEMPVDVWNIHNFILREEFQRYGADIPPGFAADDARAVIYESDWTHIDLALFDQQIRAFRAWMAERGQQEKPLIVSEYGVLYRHCALWRWTGTDFVCDQSFNDEQVVVDFMRATFDYFLNERDCTLGYVADGCRLVQRWLWFSLDQPTTGYNVHARLYDSATHSLTPAGIAFRDWVAAHRDALAQPIPTDDLPRIYLPRVGK
ncbi:MAG: hypothetical protein DWI57_06895 [Chloroflexi bacterium]|nr:MAG: hypothetical protein DWI57_06895 [Chloroflexota bacterium]